MQLQVLIVQLTFQMLIALLTHMRVTWSANLLQHQIQLQRQLLIQLRLQSLRQFQHQHQCQLLIRWFNLKLLVKQRVQQRNQ